MKKILNNEKGQYIGMNVLPIAILAVMLVLGVILIMSFISNIPKGVASETPIESLIFTEKIYSLKDNSEIEGDFFLGTGSVEEEQVYRYMAQNDAGGLIQKEVDIDSAQIYYLEDENAEPYVEKYRYEQQLVFLPLITYEYHFYLPKGSVTTDFNVDME